MSTPNLHFWHGEESFLIAKKVALWKRAFAEKHGEINISEIDGAKTDAATIVSEMETMPFLGEKRLILVRNLPPQTTEKIDEKKSERLISAIKTIPDTSVVLFVQSFPDKRLSLYKAIFSIATTEEFAPLSREKVMAWIGAECQKTGTKFLPAALPFFVERVGTDLWKVASELEKLTAFCDGKAISERDIALLCDATLETRVFEMIDKMGEKSTHAAVFEFSKIVESGESLMGVFHLLVRQARLLLGAAELVSQGEGRSIASRLKVAPFVANKLERQTKRFSEKEICALHTALFEVERSIKTGAIRIATNDETELALALSAILVRFSTPSAHQLPPKI